MAFTPAYAQPESLCDEEKILFSCPLRSTQKWVSVCASADVSKTAGYLQYRFGTAGAIELAYPADRAQSQTQFRYGHYSRYQTDRTRVYFSTNGFTYEIFDDFENDGGPKIDEEGIRIYKQPPHGEAQLIKTYVCAGKATNHLVALEPILSCDKDEVDCPTAN